MKMIDLRNFLLMKLDSKSISEEDTKIYAKTLTKITNYLSKDLQMPIDALFLLTDDVEISDSIEEILAVLKNISENTIQQKKHVQKRKKESVFNKKLNTKTLKKRKDKWLTMPEPLLEIQEDILPDSIKKQI